MITLRKRPYDINWSGNQIVYSFFSEAAKNNLDLVFEVKLYFRNYEDLSDFKEIAIIPLTPYKGEASIDVAELLRSQLEFTLPTLWADSSDARKQTGEFYIIYREYDIDESASESWLSTEVDYKRKVLKGGIAPFLWKGNNYWHNYYPTQKPFLTWQRSGRYTGLFERIFLAWFNNTNIAAGKIICIVKCTYTDKSTSEKSVTVAVLPNRIAYIPVGAVDRDIITAGKTIWYWDVAVYDNTVSSSPVLISQVFRYVNDQRNDYNNQTLFYRNSLGGIDSVRIRGVIETTITLDGGDAETIEPFTDGATVLPRLDRSIAHREIPSFKGDIGHLDKNDQDRLRDAFLSREVWVEKYGRWWPVKLLTKQYKLRSTQDKRFVLPIDWTIADGGSYYYTPDIDLGSGILINNVCSAVITNVQHSLTYGAGNTLGMVSYTFQVDDPDGININKVQYRIPGYQEDWKDLAYPYVNPLQTNHAVPSSYIIYFRAICPVGQPGPVNAYAVTVPVVGAPPQVNNTNLYNETLVATPFTLSVNGAEVTGILQAGEYSSFTFADQQNVTIRLDLRFVTPTNALLQTGDDIIEGTISGSSIYFYNVNIVNGFYIEFR